MAAPRVAETGVLSRPRVQAVVLLGTTAIALYLCYLIVQPFLAALSWGLALAVVGYPIHKFICRRLPRPTLSAALTVLTVAVVIIGPVAFVTHRLVRQATDTAAYAQQVIATGGWREVIERQPQLAALTGWVESVVSLDQLAPHLGGYLEKVPPALVLGTLTAVTQLLITLFVLFYFFRDKRDLTGDLRSYLPLSDRESDALIARITDTIYATIFGSLVVAAIQGFMGGLMFWFLGLPAPLLWGAVMAVLATIPVAGTFVVWAPTAAYLALSGSVGKALILAAWGGIAIALIDNVLYPILVGKRLHFHPLPVFFSIVGGLWLFGMAGLVLGPLTLSVTSALLDVLRRRTAAQRAVDGRRTARAA
jgi:predicted PurR-regulated permease PerM